MRLLLFSLVILTASLQAQPGLVFTRQPASRAALAGGEAEFSFAVRAPHDVSRGDGGVLFEFTVFVLRGEADVSARFAMIERKTQIVAGAYPGDYYATAEYTLRIGGLTPADAGTLRFLVGRSAQAAAATASQPVELSLSAAAAALPRIASLTPGFAIEEGAATGFPLQVTLEPGSAATRYQWYKNGLPLAGETSPTYRGPQSPRFADSGVYHVVLTHEAGVVTSPPILALVRSAGGPTLAPGPASVEVAVGERAIFEASSGSPLQRPTFQWLYRGYAIPQGASSQYWIESVSQPMAGEYAVLVVDAQLGAAVSPPATLRVHALAAPSFVAHPQSVTQVAGHSVALTVAASGQPAPTLQWYKDGIALAGATSGRLTLVNAREADAGAYTVVATNSSGSATSEPALVRIVPAPDTALAPARLVNLSVLAHLEPGETMTLGAVLAGASGTRPLLLRAAGPSLAPLGVREPLPDPRLALYAGPALLAANDDWGGSAALRAVFTAVGAFAYLSETSRDAALLQPALPAANYTLQVSGGQGSGPVIAELYDATPAGMAPAAAPRLVNISTLKTLRPGATRTLTLGFVVGGSGTCTVLIRAVGPTLGLVPFNLAGTLADPQLILRNERQTVLADNDDWGRQLTGTSLASIAAATESVGAFRLAGPASKDAVLLLQLYPGSYTAEARGADFAGGLGLVEVYEVP